MRFCQSHVATVVHRFVPFRRGRANRISVQFICLFQICTEHFSNFAAVIYMTGTIWNGTTGKSIMLIRAPSRPSSSHEIDHIPSQHVGFDHYIDIIFTAYWLISIIEAFLGAIIKVHLKVRVSCIVLVEKILSTALSAQLTRSISLSVFSLGKEISSSLMCKSSLAHQCRDIWTHGRL